MRIGIDISPLTATRTGVGNYCYYLLKHMIAIGTDCEFAGFSSGRSRIELGPCAGKLSHLHVPLPTRALYAIWSVLGAPKVDTLLGGVDVLHATNYFMPPAKRARRVVSFYDLAFLIAPELCSPKIRGIFSKQVRRFAREADAIVACSESTKADIVRLLDVDPAKIAVAYGAVDEDFAPMDADAAEHLVGERLGVYGPYLLFVGTLEPRKNVPTLLRAFARLAKEIPHKLILAGGQGWNAGEILETIEALGLSGRVVRAGYVQTQGELGALYSAADAFVFPSLYEGFGLPVVEAMKCGCPVVTSDNSSMPEVGGSAAVYCDAQDAEGLASAIRGVLEDTALRENLAASGLERAKRFSWQACAETTLGVYRKVGEGNAC